MNGACHDGAASTLGSAPILSVLVAAPTQENEMSRSLRGLALPAAALLALALGAVSPAVADTPSDASSPEPSTYTTPAKPGVDVAEAPTPAAPKRKPFWRRFNSFAPCTTVFPAGRNSSALSRAAAKFRKNGATNG